MHFRPEFDQKLLVIVENEDADSLFNSLSSDMLTTASDEAEIV